MVLKSYFDSCMYHELVYRYAYLYLFPNNNSMCGWYCLVQSFFCFPSYLKIFYASRRFCSWKIKTPTSSTPVNQIRRAACVYFNTPRGLLTIRQRSFTVFVCSVRVYGRMYAYYWHFVIEVYKIKCPVMDKFELVGHHNSRDVLTTNPSVWLMEVLLCK